MFVAHEINVWSFNIGKDFELGISLFRPLKLIKNDDPDKYKYSGYGIGFDAWGNFLLWNGSRFGKSCSYWFSV